MSDAPEIARLRRQIQAAFEGPAWHGPSVMEALRGVTAAQAAARPLASAHTIWELALHLGGTYLLVLRRLRGDATPLADCDDWPALPPTLDSEAWTATLERLRALNQDVRAALSSFDAGQLGLPLQHPSYDAYTQFIGITQHDLYHAGQIVLLRKTMGSQDD